MVDHPTSTNEDRDSPAYRDARRLLDEFPIRHITGEWTVTRECRVCRNWTVDLTGEPGGTIPILEPAKKARSHLADNPACQLIVSLTFPI